MIPNEATGLQQDQSHPQKTETLRHAVGSKSQITIIRQIRRLVNLNQLLSIQPSSTETS